ncbi:hypothetical protein [Mesoplasma lactucae]|uniref:Uncharacterized protein n=1 Tax=Mesoplasma lactucae ATCC 49193 TaxID=81460 RepID=A0A291IRJ0_9MOLU|nr:hypothetical protein [Mesoplasma lactucae]ATG97399.1 hypothetical protein CP520_01330 [Mesoplasma lactucae ATCC 49193]ATZ20148.1 hypothetical protein MLACT_v1c03270 [Mesoplasma lactucae ATCC 49193]MCL8216896.1 hypothetical protein [Mesoplasma lactucae ATCC 49193]
MDKKLNEVINLNDIVLDILKDDLKNFEKIIEINKVEKPSYFDKTLSLIKDSTDLNEVVGELGKLFDHLASDNDLDLAILTQQFLQRYTFFLQTIADYDQFSGNFSANMINGHNTAEIFQAIFVPFFSEQINLYYENLKKGLQIYDVKDWSKTVDKELKEYLNKGLEQKDFITKIQDVEDLINYLSDPQKLYKELNISFTEPNDPSKEAFLAQLSQFKIILQSIDILVEHVIKAVDKVAG